MSGSEWVNILFDASERRNMAPMRSVFKKPTPLAVAVSKKSTEQVISLIEQGCNIDQEVGDWSGDTALFHAIKTGQVNIVKLLIDAGANINHESFGKSRPIYEALCWRRKEIVELLLAHKVELECSNKQNKSPIQVALKFYLDGYNFISPISHQQSPSSMQDIVRRLVPEVDLSEDIDDYLKKEDLNFYLLKLVKVQSPLFSELMQHVTVNMGFICEYFELWRRLMMYTPSQQIFQHANFTEEVFWFVHQASSFEDISWLFESTVKDIQKGLSRCDAKRFRRSKEWMLYVACTKNFFRNPLDLETLCCQVIRKQLSNNRMWYRIDQLDIPILLKKRLKLIK